LNDPLPRYAVAYFLVNGDAHALREPPLIQGSRDSSILHREFMDKRVDLIRGHAGF
jgi:hypothetical protein